MLFFFTQRWRAGQRMPRFDIYSLKKKCSLIIYGVEPEYQKGRVAMKENWWEKKMNESILNWNKSWKARRRSVCVPIKKRDSILFYIDDVFFNCRRLFFTTSLGALRCVSVFFFGFFFITFRFICPEIP